MTDKHIHPMTLRECMEAEEPSGPNNPRQLEIDAATKPLHLRIEQLEKQLAGAASHNGQVWAKAQAVIEAARYIHHWHDWGKENEGMVVSSEHVRKLWEAIGQYDKSALPAPPSEANGPESRTELPKRIDGKQLLEIALRHDKPVAGYQFADKFDFDAIAEELNTLLQG